MNVYDNSTFFKYDAYLELWNILDTPLENFNRDEPLDAGSMTTEASGSYYRTHSQSQTPLVHSQTQQREDMGNDVQSALLGIFGCGLVLFLVFQFLFVKRKCLFKKNSWIVGNSDKTLVSPIVKKEDTTIWSPEYHQSVKPGGQTSSFMLTPHPFRIPLQYHESLNFCSEGETHRKESSKSSESSSRVSCASHIQGKCAKYGHKSGHNCGGETTVFMVDSRGHFTPRLSVSPPGYLNNSSTPSNGSCVSCGSLHYGITYTSKVNGVISRSHSVLTFEGPAKLCLPSPRRSTVSDNSVSMFRCEECYAVCERNRSLSPTDEGHYGPSVSLLPDNAQLEMPMSVARDSLSSTSSLSNK